MLCALSKHHLPGLGVALGLEADGGDTGGGGGLVHLQLSAQLHGALRKWGGTQEYLEMMVEALRGGM